MIRPHPQNSDDNSNEGGDGGEDPDAHCHFGFRPALGFEVMMNGSGEENLAMEKLFGGHLNHDWAWFEHIDKNDNKQN